MDIVSRLKQFLQQNGIANSLFADTCDIPRPTLSQLLNGRNKKVSDEVIAQALQMPLEDYAQTIIDQMLESVASESSTYSDVDGKLVWEDGAESPYTLTADTLEFAVGTLGDLVFHRIG